ncbi:SRPBCC family protein [Paenibacillus sp. 1P07SE]
MEEKGQEEVVASVEMLIRKPANEVFEAFIDPAVTTKFWFTKSSGRLEKGKRVRWDWECYGVGDDVDVIDIVENQRIFVRFNDGTTVEWTFAERAGDETYVTIVHAGFQGTAEEIVKQAIDSKGGFMIVVCGLKALLEHGVVLNLVADQFPDAHVNP